jgi:prepilin-type N-terminal cleavage/methylation domain-containing protein
MTVLKANRPRGFTIVELLIVIAIISFIAALLLPALSGAKNKGKGADCISRLKQIGVGLRLWANDNDDAFPWAVEVIKGGSMGSIDWTDNFRAAANELSTPKILVCPSDTERTAGDKWSTLDGDRHISFFLGYDAQESKSQTVLAGDRNVYGGGGGNDLTWNTAVGSSVDATWDDTMHVRQGYVVLSDASVHHTTTGQLKEQVSSALSVGGSTNVIFSLPRGVY